MAGDLEWSRLSERSFARDWMSRADAVYDDLEQGGFAPSGSTGSIPAEDRGLAVTEGGAEGEFGTSRRARRQAGGAMIASSVSGLGSGSCHSHVGSSQKPGNTAEW